MDSRGDELQPRTTVAVGDRVVGGRYLVRALLGKGGVGHVFEVENESIGRRFALKVLHWNIVEPEQVKRFHREARALGRVSSPHAAQVIDFAIDPALGPYLVMELLEGETLRDLLQRRGRLPLDEALALAVDLCHALDEVHRAGIVHRDLKPSNIGLPRGGAVRVKLLDFGLAASFDGAFAEQLTQSQQFLGTMPYMAPELFRGTAPSPSFDLYALGVVLFQMLTGQTPFKGPTPAVYIQQHLFAPVPRLREAAPELELPGWIDQLVHNLLAKLPEERLASATAVGAALATGMAGQPLKLERPRSGRGRGRWLLAAALLAAAGAGGLWAARHRRTRIEQETRARLEAKRMVTPTPVPTPTPAPVVAEPAPAEPTAPPRKQPGKRRKVQRKSTQWNGEIIESE